MTNNGTEPVSVKISEEQKTDPVPVKSVVSGTWKEMVARWVFDQSVSTVLLVSILAVGIYGVPNYLLPAIGDGYKHNAAALEKSMAQQNEACGKIMQLMIDNHSRDRESFERVINEIDRRK